MGERTGPIILFGGTFDPPHLGHVELPLQAADLVGSGRVIYMPARMNPQKTDRPPTAAEHRLAMLTEALREKGDPRAEISTLELDREGPSYSIQTIETLHEELATAESPLRLLIGTDQALNFTTWRRWQEIEALAEPLVLPRGITDRDALKSAFDRMQPGRGDVWMTRVLEIPGIKARSTDAREANARREPIEEIVPPVVEEYIRRNGLYA